MEADATANAESAMNRVKTLPTNVCYCDPELTLALAQEQRPMLCLFNGAIEAARMKMAAKVPARRRRGDNADFRFWTPRRT
jgi:hypothetical protein